MSFEIKIPLESWERTLLNDVKQTFQQSIQQQNQKFRPQAIDTFRQWAWVTHVENTLREVLDKENSEHSHQVIPNRTSEILREGLSTRGSYHSASSRYSCHSRFKGLLHENPKLKQTFSDSFVHYSLSSDISPVPADQDIEYWEIIADLRNFLFSADDKSRFNGVGPLEIDDDNSCEALNEYLRGFQDRETEQLVSADDFPGIDADTTLINEFDIWILTQEVATLGRQILYQQESSWKPLIENKVVGHLSFLYNLEYIPTSLLHITGQLGSNGLEVLWKPEIARIQDHQIFTEDEVYGYCVDHLFEIPGHRQNQSVIFIPTELTVEDLTRNRGHLQTMYNDCAFTMDPITKKTYLLETRPGRKFRALAREFGLHSARSHLRSLVDMTRLERGLQLRDILQEVDQTIPERYEGIVDAIPFSELEIANERVSDNVHFGNWWCRQKLGMAQPQKYEIVLKKMWPPDKRQSQLLIRELKNTLYSFATKPIGSIELCGITLVPPEHNGGLQSGSVFLVLERAQKLGNYLEKKLSGSSTDWDLISELFWDLATSLENLHEGNYPVIHRDIHIDNIVVRQQPCPNDPFTDSYHELVIIDLGESQSSNSALFPMNTYGNPSYQAPEVELGEYSKKSDVFSAGYVMVEILRQRIDRFNESHIPKSLWDLINKCLARDATDRPSSSELAQKLQTLRQDFFCVPEEIDERNRGKVVFPDEPSEDFYVVTQAWRKSLAGQELGSEDDTWIDD